MEESVEPSMSSWLVARGNTLVDELKIRQLYWGMSWAIWYLLSSSILTAIQVFAQINTFASRTLRLGFAALCARHFLHSS